MLYLQRTKKLKIPINSKNGIVLVFLILLFIINAIDRQIIVRPLHSVALTLLSLKTYIESGTNSAFSVFQSKKNLTEENLALKKQYSSLANFCTLSIQGLKTAKAELQKTLGRNSIIGRNYIGTGYIITKPPISPYGTIETDLGSSTGIKIGDEAIVGEYLIGYVSAVLKDRSLIKLYGENGENRTLEIGSRRIGLTGQGLGLGTYKGQIANEAEISTGETVWLSGHHDFIFGKVVLAKTVSDSHYQNLIIKSPVNIFELESIEIVSPESL